MNFSMNLDWQPFEIAPPGSSPQSSRSIDSSEGVGDRLRAAAFAEIQARDAFRWAAGKFEDAPPALREAWLSLAVEEEKHMNWLLTRMTELGLDVKARKVSDHLWHSLVSCKTAREFAIYMANAEERGRQAGERFCQSLITKDPVTAQIFGKIAQEEVAHIQLASRFFSTPLELSRPNS